MELHLFTALFSFHLFLLKLPLCTHSSKHTFSISQCAFAQVGCDLQQPARLYGSWLLAAKQPHQTDNQGATQTRNHHVIPSHTARKLQPHRFDTAHLSIKEGPMQFVKFDVFIGTTALETGRNTYKSHWTIHRLWQPTPTQMQFRLQHHEALRYGEQHKNRRHIQSNFACGLDEAYHRFGVFDRASCVLH